MTDLGTEKMGTRVVHPSICSGVPWADYCFSLQGSIRDVTVASLLPWRTVKGDTGQLLLPHD